MAIAGLIRRVGSGVDGQEATQTSKEGPNHPKGRVVWVVSGPFNTSLTQQ